MRIAVILGSHRVTGKNKEIADALLQLNLAHEINFIKMAELCIQGCTSCYECAKSKKCILDDDFEEVYNQLKDADAIFIIVPVYAMIPSRLTALFERFTSLLFATGLMNTDGNPLLNKPTAIFSYCSNQICDETQLKIIFQKFLMKDYSFTEVNYHYINNGVNADQLYHHDIVEYVKDVITRL